jgi:hypothetical protein
LLTIFSLAIFFSLISSGSLSVFTDRPSAIGSSKITFASASSDGGGEEGEGGGEGDGSDDDQGTSVGGVVSEGKGIETGQVDETTNEEDTDAEDEEQQQPIPTPTLSPTPNSLRFSSLCQAVPSLCSTTPTPLVLTPRNLIPGIPIGGLPTATPTPPPLFGRNVPLQSGGLFGQQPAAIVPPTPVPTPVLTPEPPVPMFGSTQQQATPTLPPTPGSQSSTLQSLCLINPNQPQCQSTSASIPRLALTPTPNSDNTGVGQAVPKSNTGDLFASPFSSELQTELPKTTTTQRAPDTLFTRPGGDPVPADVPLRDPLLVPGPDEVGAAPKDDEEQCVAIDPRECNFPYPISQDEICRNGKDDNLNGRVDEDPYCTEVPGQSKPRPPDGVLTPETSQGPSPFGSK